MSGHEPARYLDEAAAGLRALAADLDAGRGPRRGQGLRRVARMPLLPIAVHDALCGWRVATRQDATPPILGCAGCGMAYLVEEALNRGRGGPR